MKPLVIRADASHLHGSGHIMRCLALADAWNDCGGNVVFILATSSPLLEERLSSATTEILHIASVPGSPQDAHDTARIAGTKGADWIVVDGYHFGAEYQKTLRETGSSLLVIDDYGHSDHYYADIILNQNSYADISIYKKTEPFTKFLLGTKYVLLRKEFLFTAGSKRTIPDIAKKVLVTFGGADPDNVSLSVIKALKQVWIDNLEVIVVVGGVNQNYETLRQSVKELPHFSLRKNVSTMPELMAWADVAISAGGSTCYELAFMELPSILYSLAENQKPVIESLVSLGMADLLTDGDLVNSHEGARKISEFLTSSQKRQLQSQKLKCLVDGNGPDRIISAMYPDRFHLRRARMTDCRRVWEWMNDPFVRANSFSPDFIQMDHHRNWFSAAIVSPDLVYYIALDDLGEPLGQARFSTRCGEAVISVLVDQAHRGHGFSKELIRGATERFIHETGTGMVHAYIKPKNTISKKAFVNAGYKDHGVVTVEGQDAFHLVR